MDYVIRKFLFSRSRCHSNCVSCGSDVFPCHARTVLYLMSVRNCEDESRILHDVNRNTIMSSRDSVKYWYVASKRIEGKGKYEAYLYAKWSTGKRLSSKEAGGESNFQKVPKGMPWA
ncbi:hypothetical protein T03_46 [Trichinella britovi]|uniref:Uncharacterized protein n=1 Tax=Trichinella britovi TaxID=45882 RepID=A0A0V1C3B5_TRIBR|nr:hypothetical protein T03_46 [Trichinella britovi]